MNNSLRTRAPRQSLQLSLLVLAILASACTTPSAPDTAPAAVGGTTATDSSSAPPHQVSSKEAGTAQGALMTPAPQPRPIATAPVLPPVPRPAPPPPHGYATRAHAPAAIAAPMPAPATRQAHAAMPPQHWQPPVVAPSTARYATINDNPWTRVAEAPVSTFGADVDTGSYANVRRFISRGQLPVRDAVRVEEMVNYFGYEYRAPAPSHPHPFSVYTALAASPWSADRVIMRVALKGKDLAKTALPAANLVFLVDVSGSMQPQDRLPLVKTALKLLTTQLRAMDRVTIVSYANGTRLVLPPTSGQHKGEINAAIDTLHAAGGTYGEAGIRLAYAKAEEARIDGGINRVLLATDGDLNIGVTDHNQLKGLIEGHRKSGIGLTTLGVGDSNFNEALMKSLADAGDGSYHYLDTVQEAHKVLVNQFTSTLAVIAQDVKIQVEFNPGKVSEYRLLGYELRALTREQFNDDRVDSGDVGAGHSVTALYELVLRGARGSVDPLRYGQEQRSLAAVANKSNELAWVKLRYKEPGSTQSTLVELPVVAATRLPQIEGADTEMRFATAVAAWAQWLRGNTQIGDFGPEKILTLARSARGDDPYGHRGEFVRLVEVSQSLKR